MQRIGEKSGKRAIKRYRWSNFVAVRKLAALLKVWTNSGDICLPRMQNLSESKNCSFGLSFISADKEATFSPRRRSQCDSFIPSLGCVECEFMTTWTIEALILLTISSWWCSDEVNEGAIDSSEERVAMAGVRLTSIRWTFLSSSRSRSNPNQRKSSELL